ncbi:hypothetical protein BB561_001884 [Smittium simulii]|uniref:CS domain-containing protein n=1 Tax=Smittium simulii TaxID=133385 RepID=A0A2T9YSI1_9FUNG|nr:hypothetical protein BB561_001884 [Smittium simulii]
MITPRFTVTQDDESLFINIHISHFRTQSVEIDVTGNEFKFFASPYYLRLKFPGEVEEDETSEAKLDAAEGLLAVKLSKINKGEFFPDLDLTSVLLATRTQMKELKPTTVLIEEINSTDNIALEPELEEDTDWELPQEIQENIISQSKYGFNAQYNGWFTHVDQTPNEINDIQNIENTSNSERINQQVELDNEMFNEDYYINNYIDDQEILDLIDFQSEFDKSYNLILNNKSSKTQTDVAKTEISESSIGDQAQSDKIDFFSLKEKDLMLTLPKKSWLVDIVFAYMYNYRSTLGEQNVESQWNIGKISSSCSTLREFSTLKECLISCYRRSLIYPLYRNWDLAEKVKESTLEGIAKKLRKILIEKSELDLNLDEFEDLALETSESEQSSEEELVEATYSKLAVEDKKNVAELNVENKNILLTDISSTKHTKKPLIEMLDD